MNELFEEREIEEFGGLSDEDVDLIFEDHLKWLRSERDRIQQTILILEGADSEKRWAWVERELTDIPF